MLSQKKPGANLRSQFPADRKPYTTDYDYDADSDLEEYEDWGSSDIEDSQVIPSKDKIDESDSATLFAGKSSDAKGNESSDIISVSDVESLFSDSVNTKAEAEVVVAPGTTHTGTVVVVEDVAFVT